METETCDKCGTEYEPYPVFIKNSFVEIAVWQERKEKFEHLCEDCDDEYWDGDTNGFNQ